MCVEYESVGSALVSIILIGTALGIGYHSYHLLLTTLPSLDLSFLPPNWLAALPDAGVVEEMDEANTNPLAMGVAALAILVKEWLYRATLKVAKKENSNVLLANALHHRSDAVRSISLFQFC